MSGTLEEEGQQWVGGLMSVCRLAFKSMRIMTPPTSRLTAQITNTQTSLPWGDGPFLQDLDLVVGFGRSQYASFTWADLDCIAPWMKDLVTKRIDGPGLGI
jgi:hypothetical protein